MIEKTPRIKMDLETNSLEDCYIKIVETDQKKRFDSNDLDRY
jgi:hypothetical protein